MTQMPNDSHPADTENCTHIRAPWFVFWVAFLVRVVYITLAHTYRIHGQDSFNFGWEAARIGEALATGRGYADPFATTWIPHTGPTAWLPPAYPLLVAAVFRLFGPYSALSNWLLLVINSLFSATVARAVWEIGVRCCGRPVARWSAWIWALYPAAMQYATRWAWETSMTTALFAWVIVLALRMRGVSTEGPEGEAGALQMTFRWGLFGLAWGLIALSNSTLLIFLPVCGLWLLMRPREGRRSRVAGNVLLSAVVFLVCVAPWTYRNWRVFHAWIPLRGNLGAELYMGNGPGSTGFLMSYEHPHMAPAQLRVYARLGEVQYVAMRGALAKEYIRAHPGHFAYVVFRRMYFFWAGVPSDQTWAAETLRLVSYEFASLAGLFGLGLALQRRVPAAGLMVWAFVLLPVPYYLVTVHARFRHPLEPLMCVFGVYLFQSADRRQGGAATELS